MTVDPATAKHSLVHAGQTYYFCSAGCRTKFEGEPERYGEVGSEKTEVGSEKTEVKSQKPGVGSEAGTRAADSERPPSNFQASDF